MRTKDVLLEDFEDVKIFCQYLYMDENNKIVFPNTIGVKLELKCDEELHFWCQNLNFPDTPPMLYDSNMYPDNILNIIYTLKEEPAVELPNSFANRWEEVRQLTLTQTSINRVCNN